MRKPKAPYEEPSLPRWWDSLVIVVTLVTVGILLAGLVVPPGLRALFDGLDLGCCGFFLADFGWRLWRASERWTFLRGNWLDLLASIPWVGPVRVFRLLRLVRLLRLMRLIRLVIERYDLAWVRTTALSYLARLVVLFWVVASALFYVFEQGANPAVRSVEDALWWCLTTLSTVGYGDISPVTSGGRVVAGLSMIFGVAVLGTFAGTISSLLVELRERNVRGLRSYAMEDHFLVLGWNPKAKAAVTELYHDRRYRETPVILIADLERHPLEGSRVQFVQGKPERQEVLRRAAAGRASAAVVLSNNPGDPRTDHQTVLVIAALRRLNPGIRISAEMIDPESREHFEGAGCDVIIEPTHVAAALLARGILDVGVPAVITELITTRGHGTEMYRMPIPAEFVGKSFRELSHALLDRAMIALAVGRGQELSINPSAELVIGAHDDVIVVAHEPPETAEKGPRYA